MPVILSVLLAYGMVFAQAVLLDDMMNRERAFGRASRLAAMSYLLVTALVPEWSRLSAPLVANTLAIPVLSLSVAAMNHRKAGMLMFYAGLLAGLAALIHFPAVLLILVPYFAMLTMGPFRPVVWVLALAGFLLPYYYVCCLQYLYFTWDPASVVKPFHVSLPGMAWQGVGIWTWLALLLPLTAGIWHVNRQVFRMLIRTRKCWNLFILGALLALSTPYLYASTGAALWLSMAPSLSAFHANAYVQPRRRWAPELMHCLCLLAVLLAYLYR